MTVGGPKRVNAKLQKAAPANAKASAPKSPLPVLPGKAGEFTSVSPNHGHGFLALAQLPQAAFADPAVLKTTAVAAGFVETRPEFFQHRDGGWAGKLDTGKIERGHRNTIFNIGHGSTPSPLTPPPADGSLFPTIPFGKIAPLLPKDGLAKHVSSLVAAGFVEKAPGFYEDGHGYWATDIGGSVNMGRSNQQLTSKSFLDVATYQALKSPSDFQRNHSRIASGLLAIARLPSSIDSNDIAALRKAALALGFRETSPRMFKHKDGSWVGHLQDDRVWTGLGKTMFYVKPRDLAALPLLGPEALPRANSLGTIIERLEAQGFAKSKAMLREEGFVEEAPNFFHHADDMWVAELDGQLLMGTSADARVNAKSFMPMPKPLVAGPLGFAKPPAKPTDEKWDWYKTHTALGRTPMLNHVVASRRILETIGYRKGTDARGREQWTHPDSSYVTFPPKDGYGQVPYQLGYNGWTLGQLPYNDRVTG